MLSSLRMGEKRRGGGRRGGGGVRGSFIFIFRGEKRYRPAQKGGGFSFHLAGKKKKKTGNTADMFRQNRRGRANISTRRKGGGGSLQLKWRAEKERRKGAPSS